jgi:LAO/AO transport system kinase
MWDGIHAGLKHRFAHHPAVMAALADTTAQVGDGRLAASTAARQLLTLFSSSPA